LCAYILEAIDEHFFANESLAVADVACGSGAIAITLACEEKKITCYASELNPNTLEVAKLNASENGADITFFNGDMLQPLIDNNIKLDILVSNPPYIKTSEDLDRSVVDFEPNMALFGGDDGLKFYRIILSQAHKVLNERALLAFEIGYQQKEELLLLAKEYFPDQKAEVIKDLNGKDRMLFVYVNLSK
jgi:release factor glutamine methyltransferase